MNQDVWTRAIIEQNQRWLMAYFIAVTGNHAEAEDLVQETFAQAIKHADRFDASKSLGAWLRGIARNLYLEHRRKPDRKLVTMNEATLDALDDAVAASEELHTIPGYAESRLDALKSCMGSLTERSDDVIRRRYVRNQTSKLIGAALGMSAVAVDLVLSRARKTLIECVSRKMKSVAHG